MKDVDMESVKSNTHNKIHQRAEYDPGDLWMDEYRRSQVDATGVTTGANCVTQRIRISANSELKEFSGKEREEDRALIWMGKVKSEFLRDQAPDEEKCLVFVDLMVDPSRYWYR